MHRTIEQVIRSPINKSATKQVHSFAQSPRFKNKISSTCIRDSYDLSPLMMTTHIQKKQHTLPQSHRFRQRMSTTPSPDYYRNKSFIEEKNTKHIGSTFNQATPLSFENKLKIPGPGSYTPKFVAQRNIAFTMSPRTKSPKLIKSVGPGDYEVQKYGTTSSNIYSKYSNIQFYKIGQQTRFKDKKKYQITPGPGNYGNANLNKTHETFSFGRQKKDSIFNRKTTTPGPGAYAQFSQFSQRRRQLASNLRKMEQIVYQQKRIK